MTKEMKSAMLGPGKNIFAMILILIPFSLLISILINFSDLFSYKTVIDFFLYWFVMTFTFIVFLLFSYSWDLLKKKIPNKKVQKVIFSIGVSLIIIFMLLLIFLTDSTNIIENQLYFIPILGYFLIMQYKRGRIQ